MKKIIALVFCFYSIAILGYSQNLDFVFAEKFDFESAYFRNKPSFDKPYILGNHSIDLSHYGSDFDPMGMLAGSIFQVDNDDIDYHVSYTGVPMVRVLDINQNENTDHTTVLLDLEGPCTYEFGADIGLEIFFPDKKNMTGIFHFLNTIWTSYIIADDGRKGESHSAGDMTILTGCFQDTLIYVNPDNSEIVVDAVSEYNGYVIAIDDDGYYLWSYVSEGAKYGSITNIKVHNDEILVVHDLSINSKIIYLDFDGNKSKDVIDFEGIGIFDIDFDSSDNMIICGLHNIESINTNIALNGDEFILDFEFGNLIDGFLVQYDPEGNVNWAQTISGDGYNTAFSFDMVNDNIYLTGSVSKNVTFDMNGSNSSEYYDLYQNVTYISKFLKDGSMEWVTVFESESGSEATEINVEEDVISVFGYFFFEFDSNPNPNEDEVLVSETPGSNKSFYLLQVQENTVSTIDESEIANILNPNPANSIITTSSSNAKFISLKSVSGAVLRNYNSSSIDVSDLPNGMYIVNTKTNGEIRSQLISIIH